MDQCAADGNGAVPCPGNAGVCPGLGVAFRGVLVRASQKLRPGMPSRGWDRGQSQVWYGSGAGRRILLRPTSLPGRSSEARGALAPGSLGKLVRVRGQVTAASALLPIATSIEYKCERCGGRTRLFQLDRGVAQQPAKCGSPGCPSRKLHPLAATMRTTQWRCFWVEVGGIAGRPSWCSLCGGGKGGGRKRELQAATGSGNQKCAWSPRMPLHGVQVANPDPGHPCRVSSIAVQATGDLAEAAQLSDDVSIIGIVTLAQAGNKTPGAAPARLPGVRAALCGGRSSCRQWLCWLKQNSEPAVPCGHHSPF